MPLGRAVAGPDAEAPAFERTILDNLAKAGIQNGKRQERIEFESVDSYAGAYIQATGQRDQRQDGDDAASDLPNRVELAIGPQYGHSLL